MTVALELLRRVALFSSATDAELGSMRAHAWRKAYKARELVVQQGEPGGDLFAIIHGFAKVISAGADGRDTALGIIGSGDVFGEVSAIDGGPRSATVCTLEPSELLVIPREPLIAFLQTSPKAAFHLLKTLSGSLRRLTERSEDIAFRRVGDRLAKRLAGLTEKYGQKQPDGTWRIPFRLSQQEIGELVCATRESANKQIKRWEPELISQHGGHIIVHDLEALRVHSGD